MPLLCCVRDFSASRLGCVIGQFGNALAMTLGRSDDSHFLPVIRKLFPAIQTSNIGSRESGGLGAARSAHRYWKAVTSMRATEQSVDQFSDHNFPYFLNPDGSRLLRARRLKSPSGLIPSVLFNVRQRH
jgi:hypothetical protein